MKKLTSITGREFNLTSNKSKKTWTIRTNGFKYCTYPMSNEDWNSSDFWSGNDWSNFMKTNDYYRVN